MTQLAPPGPSQGPNGSIPFGQGAAVDMLHQRLQQGPTAPRLEIPPPQNRPQGPPPGQQPTPPGAGPVQPQPAVPQAPPMPSGPAMLDIPQQPQPWRERLRTWAQHPEANGDLRALGALSALDQVPADVLRRLAQRGGS